MSPESNGGAKLPEPRFLAGFHAVAAVPSTRGARKRTPARALSNRVFAPPSSRVRSIVCNLCMMPRMRALLVGWLALAAACSSHHSFPINPQPTNQLVKDRPYDVDIPDGWNNAKPLPLVVVLHGYGANGFSQEAFFGLHSLVDARQILVAFPDGTVDQMGSHFWNADDACCNFYGSTVDDVAYLNAVLDDAQRNYNVDKHRIYLMGHSNGGFMAHRMACDSTARLAAIVAFAGDVWKDASKCNPSAPIAVLQIHGTADSMVPYQGSSDEPSAPDSVGTWAAKNHCTGGLQPTGVAPFDIDLDVPGPETKDEAWSCPAGSAAELWTMQGAEHAPNLVMPDFGNRVLDWLGKFSR
jgi:polyhydroxybutyrate depolymerase